MYKSVGRERDDRRLRTKVSNTASADTCTHLDSPGRSYAGARLRPGGRASLIRQRSVVQVHLGPPTMQRISGSAVLAGSGPTVVAAVPDPGQEDHFLARTIRGIAYVEDVEPVAAKVTLELAAFAKAQGRGRSHDLLADGGRSLKGHEGERDLGHGT